MVRCAQSQYSSVPRRAWQHVHEFASRCVASRSAPHSEGAQWTARTLDVNDLVDVHVAPRGLATCFFEREMFLDFSFVGWSSMAVAWYVQDAPLLLQHEFASLARQSFSLKQLRNQLQVIQSGHADSRCSVQDRQRTQGCAHRSPSVER